ncbi:MAG: glycosyltransferase [Acidimicrobiales bacterium]
MRILLLHNGFPGQFGPLAEALAADPENTVVFGSRRPGRLRGVVRAFYEPHREPRRETHAYLRSTEAAVLTGQAVHRMLLQLAGNGFVPDVIYAHAGWGPALYVKELLPEVRLITYLEWYHRPDGEMAAYLPPLDDDNRLRVRSLNMPALLELATSDWSVAPTELQRRQAPAIFQPRISVVHEGVDLDRFTPPPEPAGPLRAPLALGGLVLPPGAELVTYGTRGMEPHRGFPQLMRAAALVLERRPQAHVVIAGEDRVVYGSPLPEGESWRSRLLAELEGRLDRSRLHVVGALAPPQWLALLRASLVHVHLTIPFALSWSLLEAMACEALVVGSATSPVQEVIEHGRDGLLVDFFDHEALAECILGALADPGALTPLRRSARQVILDRFDRRDLLRRHTGIIADVAAGRAPTLTLV